jgi:hypothetical protein
VFVQTNGCNSKQSAKVNPVDVAYSMEVSTRVLDDYNIVESGDKILMEFTIYNLGGGNIKNATVNYCIKKESGETIQCTTETISTSTMKQLVKEFIVPKNLAEGNYYLSAEVIYGQERAFSQSSFTIEKASKIENQKTQLNVLLMVIIIAIILTFLILIVALLTGRIHIKKYRFSKYKLERIPLQVKLKQLDELKASKALTNKAYLKERTNLLAKFGESVIKNKKTFLEKIFVYCLFKVT